MAVCEEGAVEFRTIHHPPATNAERRAIYPFGAGQQIARRAATRHTTETHNGSSKGTADTFDANATPVSTVRR
ncbi:hypothetical protein E4U31_002094 [Claviceps sp. LM219 group G6]|nr:hypothetical protein E4U14_006766 [Claviceps sp. LM454 group G7]KAG6104250.1 hypothetical protein E4U31_002094 [Claviceps sp. LM219 group G6]